MAFIKAFKVGLLGLWSSFISFIIAGSVERLSRVRGLYYRYVYQPKQSGPEEKAHVPPLDDGDGHGPGQARVFMRGWRYSQPGSEHDWTPITFARDGQTPSKRRRNNRVCNDVCQFCKTCLRYIKKRIWIEKKSKKSVEWPQSLSKSRSKIFPN